MSKTYSVTEIFLSIQGEGHNVGRLAVFVRLAGCNLKCPWCDTNHSAKMEMTADDIAALARTLLPVWPRNAWHSQPLIVLTGGEPFLQLTPDLVRQLSYYDDYQVAVETNGTQDIEAFECLPWLWVTLSPKEEHPVHPSFRTLANEVKLVATPWVTPELMDEFTKRFPQAMTYLQPLDSGGEMNVNQCLKLLLARPDWRLSVQVQKFLKQP